MNATQQPLSNLLNPQANVHYRIPEYQRAYSWKLENWTHFFDDLEEDNTGHFIGSVINLMVKESGSASSDKVYELIDGQQRFTTISLLLIALHKTLSDKIKEEKDLDEEDTDTNTTMLTNIKNQLVKKVKDNHQNKITNEKIGDNYYSLRFYPATQANNRDDYLLILKNSKIIFDKLNCITEKKYFSARKFSKAYEYFISRLANKNLEQLAEFYNKINNMILIDITVDSSQDAFRLFDTLNNRGMPLSAIDIIKSKMLSAMVNENQMSLDDAYDKWKKLSDNIDGVETRFLRQYYNAFKFDDKIRVNNINQATQSQLINIYESIISNNAKYLFEDLYDKSSIYSKFYNENPTNIIEKELLEFKYINTAPTYTILMYLLSLNETDYAEDYQETFLSILKFLQKFSIRRNLTDLPRTRLMDQINIDTISACNESLKKGEKITLELIENMFTSESAEIATDEKVRDELKSNKFYENSMSRYLLIKLDEHWASREYKPNFWERNSKNGYIWTIEHIMPQKLSEEWKSIQTDGFNHDENVHKIGNLTLSAYNSKMSNSSFEKKQALGSTTVGNIKIDIGYKNKLALNNELKFGDSEDSLSNIKQWTTTEIDLRSNAMIDKLFHLLKY